jgi:hypothetical protein
MKKFYIILIALFIVGGSVAAQSCLPEGITFSTQAEINSFQINYPNCTQIEGDVTICGSNISNLNGLNVVTYIGGDFSIYDNPSLANLTGLEGLTSLGGDLSIYDNIWMTSLTGLVGLTYIGGDLSINGNSVLTSLSVLGNLTTIGGNLDICSNQHLTSLIGLDGLTSIGGYLQIESNGALTSLTGLESLNSIGGYLSIEHNSALTSLTALENMTSIGGSLHIGGNGSLISLTGLEGLTSIGGLWVDRNTALNSLSGLDNLTSIEDGLTIIYNQNLSVCEAQWLCDYISNPSGGITIYFNALGCNSVIELANTCGGSMPCLPFGNYVFVNQTDIDNFQVAFPDCTELTGEVSIGGGDIMNLDGLSVVTSITGGLDFGITYWTAIGPIYYGNPNLIDLTGLENLTSIGGSLGIVDNAVLTSLTGLDNVTSIGGYLQIGDYYSGGNHSLTSLTGLDNVEANTIENLHIADNSSLSTCAVQSICDYLVSPNGEVFIEGNATGCNSQQEVQDSCIANSVSIQERYIRNNLVLYPNPSSTAITISTPTTPNRNTFMTLYSVNGKQLITRRITEQQTVVDVSELPQGVYFVKVTDESKVQVGKIIRQ